MEIYKLILVWLVGQGNVPHIEGMVLHVTLFWLWMWLCNWATIFSMLQCNNDCWANVALGTDFKQVLLETSALCNTLLSVHAHELHPFCSEGLWVHNPGTVQEDKFCWNLYFAYGKFAQFILFKIPQWYAYTSRLKKNPNLLIYVYLNLWKCLSCARSLN